jgi:hypothetical protein
MATAQVFLGGDGWRARIGIVVPSVNTVMEPWAQRTVPAGVSVHFSLHGCTSCDCCFSFSKSHALSVSLRSVQRPSISANLLLRWEVPYVVG